ncbi:alpha/beta hydrolase family protein [Bremerella sp. T1]|uniref:alpha/beta hydrolase family protein n=1 Tax=Bremerella sp. TYQ1 TaxID=3119568 RepID=UPI001CCDA853|nr:prolyl oligopeptidase family serine peptidase [Bremerella volcania]UBM34414.1 prolyl oligopeptidase family serine peptidase [Bremerella volcania]
MSPRFLNVLLGISLLGLAGLACSQNPPVNETIIETEVADQLLAPPNYWRDLAKTMPNPQFQLRGSGGRKAIVNTRLPDGQPMTLWIYQPDPLPQAKVPCVFIAPAGTMMIHGLGLAEGDSPEHIPWVNAGFAVVAYELSGPADAESSTDPEFKEAAEKFRAAKSGLLNAQVAMAYAREKVSFVDPDQFYTAGHSSAGTMALYVAEMEPQVKGTIAFMPAVDVRESLGIEAISYVQNNGILSDAGVYVNEISPITHIHRISQPTFLLIVGDDREDLRDPAESFGKKLREMGKDVTVVRIPRGGHYEPMLDPGIPMAIDWLKMVTDNR